MPTPPVHTSADTWSRDGRLLSDPEEVVDTFDMLLTLYWSCHPQAYLVRHDVRILPQVPMESRDAICQAFLIGLSAERHMIGEDPAFLWLRERSRDGADRLCAMFLLDGACRRPEHFRRSADAVIRSLDRDFRWCRTIDPLDDGDRLFRGVLLDKDTFLLTPSCRLAFDGIASLANGDNASGPRRYGTCLQP